MSTDNRANEPNKYAGFLARQNHQRDQWLYGVKCLCGKGFDLDADHALHQVEEILRAALVAAQGAARPVNGFDTTAERVKNGADSLHVTPQEPSRLPDFFAPKPMPNSYVPAPVLPSSGVDEDALAEVIGSLDWGYMVDGPSVSEIARAVAEWLKE